MMVTVLMAMMAIFQHFDQNNDYEEDGDEEEADWGVPSEAELPYQCSQSRLTIGPGHPSAPVQHPPPIPPYNPPPRPIPIP